MARPILTLPQVSRFACFTWVGFAGSGNSASPNKAVKLGLVGRNAHLLSSLGHGDIYMERVLVHTHTYVSTLVSTYIPLLMHCNSLSL